MARLDFTLRTEAEVALVADTAKTVLQVRAPTNQRVAVKGIVLTFDGVSVTAAPVNVRLVRQTTNGTMTAATPRKGDDDVATAIQSTGGYNATAEPTNGDVLRRFHVHPQAGYERVWGYKEEYVVGGGDRIGVEITAPAGVNCLCTLDCEE